MTLHLYDTMQREIRLFSPLDKNNVGLYCCGPTVYNFQHIGNLRTYLFEDTLRRVLEYNGYEVNHVINITDVGHLTSDGDTGQDKMELSAERTGEDAWSLAKRYTDSFREDLKLLNVLDPHVWCKATDHIEEQIESIKVIESQGYTYKTSDGIYFDTSRLNDYGYLARLDINGLQAGARVELGEKKRITDFALWKFSPKNEKRQMEWESPWGIGFPGWHIECSAMSNKYLGEFFDIHCGGEDHVPVHHTNEIAQAQACYETRLANFWVHGAFLQLGGMKMSKSSGDFLRLSTLIERGYDPLAYRFFCLGARYRAKLTFGWESLDAASNAFTRLRKTIVEWGQPTVENSDFINRFRRHIDDDLNMPRVLALVWELVGSNLDDGTKKATLLHFDKILGLNLKDSETFTSNENSLKIPQTVKNLATQRQQARLAKNWITADKLRDEIMEAGFNIEDSMNGPILIPKLPLQIERWIQERDSARKMKNWSLADEIRDKILAAGFEVIDGPTGTEAQSIS